MLSSGQALFLACIYYYPRRCQVGKFTHSGPDWIDVEALLRAIDALHGGKTGLLISAEGIGGGTGLRTEVYTVLELLPGSDQVVEVKTESVWPCGSGATLVNHIFQGLYRHDYEVCQAYRQEKLPAA